MKKRFLGIILSLIMVFGSTATMSAAKCCCELGDDPLSARLYPIILPVTAHATCCCELGDDPLR